MLPSVSLANNRIRSCDFGLLRVVRFPGAGLKQLTTASAEFEWWCHLGHFGEPVRLIFQLALECARSDTERVWYREQH